MSKRDYYEVLGVARDANVVEIHKAFRARSKECHPDHHPEREAEFRELNAAYQVLKDPRKRRDYDLTGHAEDGMSIEVIFANLLPQVFQKMENSMLTNPVVTLLDFLDDEQRKFEARRTDCIRQAAIWRRRRKELRSRSGARHVMLEWVEGRVNEFTKGASDCAQSLEIGKELIKLAQDVEWTPDFSPEELPPKGPLFRTIKQIRPEWP